MFNNIWIFLKSISFIDYVFFFTVVFLIVLVVSLIYFIKINEEIIETAEKLDNPEGLKELAEQIKIEPKTVQFTSYEKEQEDRAIISYDELLNNTGEFQLNYASEEQKGDVSVKKVDLNNLVNTSAKLEIKKPDVHVISLKREEDFLKALKELKEQLN